MSEKIMVSWLPILPVFTLLNVCLSYLVSVKAPFLGYCAKPLFIYSGLFLVCLNGLFSIKNRVRFKYRHDLFATGCLVIWFGYWQRFHSIQDAPLFFAYPLFFTLLSVVLSYSLVWKRETLDLLELRQFLNFSRIRWLTFPILMLITLVSLLSPTNLYQTFPIIMALFMIRHSIVLSLES